MANLINLQHLLHDTRKIVDHHDQLTIAKGEHFNIFSVLDIETRENKTHSAFLAELLNPKGSHKQKNKFLNLFLQVIGREMPDKNAVGKLVSNYVNSAKTSVITEFSIGKRNDTEKEGGRLDIFIKNGDNCICIENKIHAQDQKAQIERYRNYNSVGENQVFYLTLKGEDPHQDSKGELESGEHFFNISYREHIVEWLELCLKEVQNLTSVREAINQYILLIKKITNTLHMEQEMELQSLMSTYLEESRYIARKYEKMISDFQSKFRKDVEGGLREMLPDYEIRKDRQTANKFSKLWIYRKQWEEFDLKFGLEPFSGKGHGNGFLFIGLLDKNDLDFVKDIPEENRLNNGWKHTRVIRTEDENEIKLQDLYTLNILAKPEDERYSKLLNGVIEVTVKFVEEYEKKLSDSYTRIAHKPAK